MFLRNCWYAAGFPDEIGRRPLARTFLNERVVLFRTEDGVPVALEDRCAHRRLPLSLGRLLGDTVQCAYHGLVYDAAGRCIKIPGEGRVPAGTGVRCYPVVDRHRFTWIWMGDPARADVALVPGYGRLDEPGWGRTRIQFHVACHYQLIIDNLLDLSHLAYLHGTTTGTPAIAEDARVKVERDGDTVQVRRWGAAMPVAPTFARFGGFTGRIDTWQISEFRPPAYVRVSYGAAPAGTGIPDGEGFWTQGQWGFQVYHGITPETERTTHQFRYVTHPAGPADAAALADFYRECDQIIGEDVAIFPVQQQAIDTDPAASAEDINSRVTIIHDGGLVLARQILARRLAEEGKPPA
jgi:vanillate O-demethylase monooxygenase subunit